MSANASLSRRPMQVRTRSTRSRRAHRLARALGIAFLLPDLAGAEPIRLGHQFVVNTYTYSYQRRTDVAAKPDGGFIVVWRSSQWQPSDYEFAVLGQRFDAQGGRQGGEFLVNSLTSSVQDRPSIAVAGDGSFVVVWESYPGYYHMAAQRFSSTGAPVGGEFKVNSSIGLTYYTSSVSMSTDGSFVVAWTHTSGDYYGVTFGDGSEYAILGRRFDSAGVAQGTDFLVNTYTTGAQDDPSVARMPDGSFVVVWQDNERESVVGRRYDSAGAPVGGEVTISESPTQFSSPRVAGAPGQGFAVVWGSGDVLARRFDNTGAPQGGEFVVNQTPAATYRSDVTMATDGSFVVAWTAGAYPGDVRARRFDSTGAPEGGQFSVREVGGVEGVYRNSLAISGPGDGSFVVAWLSDDGYEDPDIAGARFGVGSVGCPPAPSATCRETTVAGRGVLRFRDNLTNDARDALTWQWVRGEAVTSLEMGDPFTGTAYAVCLYDGSGATQPILHMESTAGGPCNQVNCWRPFNGGVVEFFDRSHLQGGLERVRLAPGAAGRTKVFVKAIGESLDLPATPLTAPVTMQLHGSNGTCWSSTYSTTILKNADGQFRARPNAATP
jgi:hypothetical protein